MANFQILAVLEELLNGLVVICVARMVLAQSAFFVHVKNLDFLEGPTGYE